MDAGVLSEENRMNVGKRGSLKASRPGNEGERVRRRERGGFDGAEVGTEPCWFGRFTVDKPPE